MRTRACGGLAGLLLLAAPVWAGLFAPRSLLDLEQSADLIVVGEAGGESHPGAPESFLIDVRRVVKGDPALSGERITVNSSVVQYAAGAGIWFLKAAPTGWQLFPVIDGDVPFFSTFFPGPTGPLPGTWARSPDAPLSDKLASELGAAMEDANPVPAQFIFLENGLLDQLKSPVVQLIYRRLSMSAKPAQREAGLGGMLRAGNAAALTSAAQTPFAFRENGLLLSTLRREFRATDADSVDALGQLATSPNLSPALRQAASHALAAIHTRAALPYLATLLDDSDAALRVEAIGGMGSFANGLAVQTSGNASTLPWLQRPADAPYKTAETLANFGVGRLAIERNESAYLSFWRAWWSQNRAALGY